MNDGLLGLLLISTPTPTTSSSFAQQPAFYNNLVVRPAMVAFDLMQIGDLPLNDQHVNVPPYPVHNSRPTVNVARLPYRKENITGAFVTEDRKHYLGPMNYACIHCGALKFLLEQSSLCCNEGSIDLPRVTWPVQYRALFATRDEYSKDFLKNVRMYNSAFAMVSTACKLDPRVNNRGIPTYRVQGSIHHYIGGILPDDGATQNFAQVRNITNTQIYFNDEEAGFNRSERNFRRVKNGNSFFFTRHPSCA